MPILFQPPRGVIFASGTVVPNAYVYFFVTESTTPKDIYADVDLATELSNPVQADSTGTLPVIYLDTSTSLYRVRITDEDGVQISQDDGIGQTLSATEVGEVLYPVTVEETDQDVTPTNQAYPFGDGRRYGANNLTNGQGLFSGDITDTIGAFVSNRAITVHGIYGFADVGSITPPSSGTNGHATFNDRITLQGTNNFDHHHSYQAWPILNNSGTLDRYTAFWTRPNIQQGTFNNFFLIYADIDYASGTFGTLEGLRIDDFSGLSASTKYAIHTLGTTPSLFEGRITSHVGLQAASATPLGSSLVQIAAAATPGLSWTNTGAATDYKLWDMYVDNTTLRGRVLEDDLGGSADWLTVTRNLATVVSVMLGGLLRFATTPTEYADDAAAAAGGIPVGGVYRTGSALKVRVA